MHQDRSDQDDQGELDIEISPQFAVLDTAPQDLADSDARLGELKVQFEWVRGHEGHPLNELVDELAQSAARKTAGPSKEKIVPALKFAL